MPAPGLLPAFALSLLLHALLIGATAWSRHPAAPPRPTPASLEALLVVPASRDDDLLKDTIAETSAVATPARPAAPARVPSPQREIAQAQRKLAAHVYYPPEAVARGLEGEARILLTLTDDGRVADAQVAAGSGHAILDQAAVRAAFALGSLPGMSRRELILPVVFRLQ